MNKNKPKLYILPGWGEKATQKGYKNLIAFAKRKYSIVILKYISKKGVLFSKNIELVSKQIQKPSAYDIIFGFSLGALIAFKLSTKFKFKRAIICSMSPILDNDLSLYPKSEVNKLFTKIEIRELNKMKYGKAKCPVVFICGAEETKEVLNRSKLLLKRNKGKLVLVEKQGHTFSGEYVKQVKKELFDI